YRRRLWRMLVSLRLLIAPPGRRAGISADERSADREHLRLAWLVALGTVPAVIAGLFFKDFFERFFYSPHLVSIFLLVTGALLFCSRLAVRVDERRLLWWAALLIGVAQAAAIFPGISRSGATIAAGLLLGLKPGEAAEFSFLLALPAILGAGLLEFLGLPGGGTSAAAAEMAALLPGFAAALVSGYLAIVLLLKVLLAGRFDRFAYYCWSVGIAGLVLL
ncbi:MAG: undecaprenyl-diphosphate phosphatase, partial [Candidatus Glassbacteria bacterium]|nr:undecaprenyl-diphosphate phosphatase [Candidatus Glassbacteria bacterium]